MSLEKKIIVFVILLTIIPLGIWFYFQVRPKPGELTKDLGRGHVPVGTKVDYATIPPTSGPHYEVWTRSGVYDKVLDDRNLVHSLEHGYIIISYNCDLSSRLRSNNNLFLDKVSRFVYPSNGVRSYLNSKIYAQDANVRDMLLSTPSAQPLPNIKLSKNFQSADCKNLVSDLTKIYNDKGKKRIIIVPRPNMDMPLALTAWRRLQKLNSFDKNKINYFIDTLINEGPEKTME